MASADDFSSKSCGSNPLQKGKSLGNSVCRTPVPGSKASPKQRGNISSDKTHEHYLALLESNEQLKLLYSDICEKELELGIICKTYYKNTGDIQNLKDISSICLKAALLYKKLIKFTETLELGCDLEQRLWTVFVHPSQQILKDAYKKNIHITQDIQSISANFISRLHIIYNGVLDIIKNHWNNSARDRHAIHHWSSLISHIADIERYFIKFHNDVRSENIIRFTSWNRVIALYKQAAIMEPCNALCWSKIAVTSIYRDFRLDALCACYKSLSDDPSFKNAKELIKLIFDSNREDNDKSVHDTLEQKFISIHGIFFTKTNTESLPGLCEDFFESLKNSFGCLTSERNRNASMWFTLALMNTLAPVVAEFRSNTSETIINHWVHLTMGILKLSACQTISVLKSKPVISSSEIIYIFIMILWMSNLKGKWTQLYSSQYYVNIRKVVNMCNAIIEDYSWDLDCQKGSVEIPVEYLYLRGSKLFENTRISKITIDELSKDSEHIDGFLQGLTNSNTGQTDYRTHNLWNSRLRNVIDATKELAKSFPCIKFDDGRFTFVPLTENEKKESDNAIPKKKSDNRALKKQPVIDVECESDIIRLQNLKEKLSGALSKHEKMKNEISSEKSTVKISPGHTVLIFDTNCYILFLDLIKKLINKKEWVISVPLVVVAELDGLKNNSDSLGISASEAIEFLEKLFGEQYETYQPWVKLQTSFGNFLNQLNIRTENWQGFDYNSTKNKSTARDIMQHGKLACDDIILRCCLYFQHSQTPSDSSSSTSKNCRIAPVALITGDINFKLKARIANVHTVNDPQTFLRNHLQPP